MQFDSPQLDSSWIVAVAVLCVVAYWVIHWLVTRPGDKVRAVGKRPPVEAMSQHGRMSVAAFGTFGGASALRLAHTLLRANCSGQVGAFQMMELNRERQRAVARQFPRGYRVDWGGSPLALHGLGNMPIDQVDTPEMRAKWAVDVRQAVRRFCALVRRPGLLHPAIDPSILLCFVSTGGHLLVGIEGARLFRKEFPGADLYAVTIWPDQEAQQRELAKALRLHAEDPIFRWWLVTDNLLNKAKNDRAVALLFACLTQAHRVLPHMEDAYNILRSIYPRGNGSGVGVTRFWERTDVAVYPTPLPPRDYLINRGDVVTAVLQGIADLDADDTKTILLETPRAETRRFVIVDVPLRQPYLADLEQEVRERLTVAGWFESGFPHRTLMFSSLGQELRPSTRFITVSVLGLEMATVGTDGVVAMEPPEPVTTEAVGSAEPVLHRNGALPAAAPAPAIPMESADPSAVKPGAGPLG